ncbi:SMI1/KNR4 family protein [Sorangium sp. So ce1335]|uniref:SMI1/KNR4 family protein n=1 Tax=Sorangium sp. So ce1335 TaxID=3133335 RepID=UPI003F6031EB
MTTIENHGSKILDADISNLEWRIGAVLPDEYRRFLLEFNGGNPVPDTVDVEGLPGVSADVQVLFGIGRSMESSNIDWNLTALAERLEAGMLPIATDSSGNVFCLALQGHRRGSVFCCDLESVFGDLAATPQLFQVAPNFDVFMTQLRPFS